MKKFQYVIVCMIVLCQSSMAQISKAVDVNKVPPQWVWKKGYHQSQWDVTAPIQTEIKRIFQPLPDGIHTTFGVAWGNDFLMGTGTPRDYSAYLMLKKFEFNSFTKKIIPEGETGCWIYFQPNTLTQSHWQLPGFVDKIRYNGTDQYLFLCNIRIEKDDNGNRVLYTDSYGRENVRQGYVFSGNGRIPVRRLTRKELFTSYKLHMEKVWNDLITKSEKSIAKDESYYNNLSAEQKKTENYWPDLLQRNKKDLNEYKQNKVQLLQWYNAQMQLSNLDAPAVVENLFENIDVKKLDVKEGFNIWTDDASFFDKTKDKDQMQFLYLHIRRQDADLPKKLFMDRFFEAFNLDVLCKLTGEAEKKPGALNTITQSITTTKTETKTAQENAGPLSINFQKEAAGSFPAGWNGMKNIAVENYENSKWLTLSKAGYWYPRQFNKTIDDGFTLTFNLEWNKDISYYNGLFAVTLAEMEYDNITQGFKTAGNESDYYSFYDSYAGNFNRIVIRFDPHFNSGGQLQVTATDKRGVTVFDKKLLLPKFFTANNKHVLQIIREGNKLIVKDNGTVAGVFENIFSNTVRYNFYVFSRHRANNEAATDKYYLNNVQVEY
jgi:hypothetical protein